ncbi:response regulator [Luteimonas sp. MJ246]|uniref:response regulator n=1 Tax=Luteimonas sp. MJ174 TaxID=3129237 RepID=UPI0031BB78D1
MLRVLIVDDSRDDAELTEFALREARIVIECRSVQRESALPAACDGFVPDLVLCDLNLPGWSCAEALAAARRHAPEACYVILTGAEPPQGAGDLPDAHAVVLKDDPARLVELARGLVRA